jgi:3-hydroxyisobutyrate dehydrogenase-like beta-hydroxyacid dehydrogenase
VTTHHANISFARIDEETNVLHKAPTFKLIGNSLVLGSLELIAEAYTIAEKSGIGQDLVYEYIKGGLTSNPSSEEPSVR